MPATVPSVRVSRTQGPPPRVRPSQELQEHPWAHLIGETVDYFNLIGKDSHLARVAIINEPGILTNDASHPEMNITVFPAMIRDVNEGGSPAVVMRSNIAVINPGDPRPAGAREWCRRKMTSLLLERILQNPTGIARGATHGGPAGQTAPQPAGGPASSKGAAGALQQERKPAVAPGKPQAPKPGAQQKPPQGKPLNPPKGGGQQKPTASEPPLQEQLNQPITWGRLSPPMSQAVDAVADDVKLLRWEDGSDGQLEWFGRDPVTGEKRVVVAMSSNRKTLTAYQSTPEGKRAAPIFRGSPGEMSKAVLMAESYVAGVPAPEDGEEVEEEVESGRK